MRRFVSGLLLAALVLVATAPAAAAERPGSDKQQGQAQVQTLREQVSEASVEEAAALDQLEAAAGRRHQLDARLDALDRRLGEVQAQTRGAEARLAALQADFVRTQMDLGRARGGLARARLDVRDQAVSAYLGNPSGSAANSVLRSGNVRELVSTTSYLESVAEARERVIDRYRQLRDDTEGLQGSVEAKKDEAKAQRDVVMGRQAALVAVRSDLDGTRRQVVEEEVGHQAVLAGVRARVSEFESRISVLRSESDSLGGLLQGVQLGRRPQGVQGDGRLSPPIPGAAFSSLFGPRLHPIFGTVRMHNGVDIRAVTGTPIRAAAAGTVVYAGPRGGYGNTVVVDHGGSLATLYAHQSAVSVSPGSVVGRGQLIGAVGSTGFSTGPHLHFEVRVDGTPVSPLGYL